MGATIQRTRYSNTTKKVLQDDTAVTGSDDVKVVSGLNLLTNNQVCINTDIPVLSSCSTMSIYPMKDQPCYFDHHRFCDGCVCVGPKVMGEAPFSFRYISWIKVLQSIRDKIGALQWDYRCYDSPQFPQHELRSFLYLPPPFVLHTAPRDSTVRDACITGKFGFSVNLNSRDSKLVTCSDFWLNL